MISHSLLKTVVKKSTSLREVCKNLGVSRTGRTSLLVKRKIVEYNLNCGHFTRKSKYDSLEKVDDAIKALYKSENKRRRQNRKNPLKRGMIICQDSRRSDNKKGLKGNNLTPELVNSLLKKGCLYCGEKTLQMTLDRINNNLAHTVNNVNPSCIRCNLMRRDMPYAAWILLAPKIREIRKLGHFDSWNGLIH